MFEDYKDKDSVVVVFTGENKGKTTASLGMTVRALGTGWKVAYIQFIKLWEVGEHKFFADIMKVYKDKFIFHKGGKGFFEAGELSAKDVTEKEHIQAAKDTFKQALIAAQSGDYDLVVCDEINNAVHDGLLDVSDLKNLIESRATKTNLCLTGRNYPKELIELADIATDMKKIRHHYDEKYLAKEGIDY